MRIKNMFTEYIYSQMSDKYNTTKFRQPKNKLLVQRQDRPPKFVTWNQDTQGEESKKNVTHPWLITKAPFLKKKPYVSRRLDMNVTVLLNKTHGTRLSHTFRKIHTSKTYYAAPPVFQPEY